MYWHIFFLRIMIQWNLVKSIFCCRWSQCWPLYQERSWFSSEKSWNSSRTLSPWWSLMMRRSTRTKVSALHWKRNTAQTDVTPENDWLEVCNSRWRRLGVWERVNRGPGGSECHCYSWKTQQGINSTFLSFGFLFCFSQQSYVWGCSFHLSTSKFTSELTGNLSDSVSIKEVIFIAWLWLWILLDCDSGLQISLM